MTQQNPKSFQLLHVEDNELDARALQRALKKLGIELKQTWARDGVEALEVLRAPDQGQTQTAPIIILLDINMPRMNGLEFLRELRSDADLRQTPVYVLTTSDQPSDIREAYSHNVAGYIVKPVETGEYLARIRSLHDLLTVIELPGPD